MKARFGKQPHVLGEHREQAAHQKMGHVLGRMRPFQRARQPRQPVGDVARHARAAPRRVQAHRVEPDRTQHLAFFVVQQVGQGEAVGGRVGEGDVGAAAAAELAVERDGLADVHHQQEGRPAVAHLVRGQGTGVVLRLLPGALHGRVPGRGAACGRAASALPALLLDLLRQGRRRVDAVAALLGLEHEPAAAVQVDAANRAMRQRHGLLEDVGVVRLVVHRRVRPRQVERIAQLGEEELVIGALGRAGGGPAGDEGGKGESGWVRQSRRAHR